MSLIGCDILGVEIDDKAQPVHKHPFCGPTAFLLGNEVCCRCRYVAHNKIGASCMLMNLFRILRGVFLPNDKLGHLFAYFVTLVSLLHQNCDVQCGLISIVLIQGTGLSDVQRAVCDRYIYIPQYGPGTASLNVTVAASIVLHQFAVWAGFTERSRCGAKFVVGDKPQRTTRRGGGGLLKTC